MPQANHDVARRQLTLPRPKGFPHDALKRIAIDGSGKVFLSDDDTQARAPSVVGSNRYLKTVPRTPPALQQTNKDLAIVQTR
jgi:hypothetical protein